jgi:hypothetical protein
MKGFVNSVEEYCRPEWEGTKMLVFILLSTLFRTGWLWSNDKTIIKYFIHCKFKIWTQWSKVFRGKISHPATRGIPVTSGLHVLFSVFTRVPHKSPAQATWTQIMILQPYAFKINFNIGLPPRQWYTSRSIHPPFYHPYTFWWNSQIIKPLLSHCNYI